MSRVMIEGETDRGSFSIANYGKTGALPTCLVLYFYPTSAVPNAEVLE